MQELQNRQKLKKLLYSWPSLIILVLITLLLARGASGVMYKEHLSAKKIENLETEAKDLEERRVLVANNIERLKTEEGVVEEIRRKFNVIRGGENLAIVIDEKVEASSTKESKESWIKRFWSAIIGK